MFQRHNGARNENEATNEKEDYTHGNDIPINSLKV